MIKIDKKQKCCGCSACVQVCPKQCIEMKEDSEGFWYPQVKRDVCVKCGLCEQVCPIIQEDSHKYSYEGIVSSYSAYSNKEEIRLASSSGGIFTILAEQIILDGGIVFGAAFDENYLVHHIAIDTIEGLSQLRGSKYLQSRIENTYIEAKKYLDSDCNVLFSGTACQIAGLKRFLRKEYENLLTVDVLCHGVPSQKVWKLYLDEKKKNSACV